METKSLAGFFPECTYHSPLGNSASTVLSQIHHVPSNRRLGVDDRDQEGADPLGGPLWLGPSVSRSKRMGRLA